MRGEEGVVRGVDRGRPQVVAVDAHRVAVHRGIDPHRGGGLERHARAEDSVAAQNGHLVPEVERLLVAEEGALVALVECGEGFGALREAGAELLQADDVGFLFGDQSRHLVGAAAAAVVVEAADVVGHHLEQTPFGDPPVVHAAEFGAVEERDAEEADEHQHQHRRGADPAPADDPVERQRDHRRIDRRRDESQQGQQPRAGGVDVGHEEGADHREARDDGEQRRHDVDEAHRQAAAPFAGRAVFGVVFGHGQKRILRLWRHQRSSSRPHSMPPTWAKWATLPVPRQPSSSSITA